MKIKIILLVFFLPLSLFAQVGGITAFSFVDVGLSPRIEAMGGSGIAIVDWDVSLGQITPSLLNAKMHNSLVFSFAFKINFFDTTPILNMHRVNL